MRTVLLRAPDHLQVRREFQATTSVCVPCRVVSCGIRPGADDSGCRAADEDGIAAGLERVGTMGPACRVLRPPFRLPFRRANGAGPRTPCSTRRHIMPPALTLNGVRRGRRIGMGAVCALLAHLVNSSGPAPVAPAGGAAALEPARRRAGACRSSRARQSHIPATLARASAGYAFIGSFHPRPTTTELDECAICVVIWSMDPRCRAVVS